MLDIHAAIDEADAPSWHDRITDAEGKHPREFSHNGWVVEALLAAWAAIHAGGTLVEVLERAVRGGRDTDTVAAIAGALIGARRGVSSIPDGWRAKLHGWPGLRADDLERLALAAVNR